MLKYFIKKCLLAIEASLRSLYKGASDEQGTACEELSFHPGFIIGEPKNI